MKLLVVSAARLGVKHAVVELVERLPSSVETTYLTIPTNPAPVGADRIDLRSESLLRALEPRQPLYLAYGIFGFWRRAYEFLAEHGERYDAVWLHNPRLLPLAPREIGPRTLVTYHNHLRGQKAEFRDPPASLYYRAFGAIEARGIDRLPGARYTVVQDAIGDQLAERGAPRDAVDYVGNGVSLDRFHPDQADETVLREAGVPDDHEVLLTLGSLTPQKQPLALLECFEAVREERDDVSLVVAGDGPLREKAERTARERGLEDVHFLGFVDEADKPGLLAAADWFVLPSAFEGEPLTLYEALASGTPALASAIPPCQFLASADCGRLLDFDDPRAAARTATEHLESSDSDALGDRARTYAEANLGWDAQADEYHDHLTQIAQC